MHSFKFIFMGCFVALVLGLGLGCGGTDSESGTPSLDTLNDLPSLDAAQYDYSTSGQSDQSSRLGVRAQMNHEGGFSRAACEGYTLKKQLFRDAQEVEMFLCYVKGMEQGMDEMTINEGEWGYYQILFPERSEEENGPPPNLRIRVGKFNGELAMDACAPEGGDEYQRQVEFRFTANSTGYTGYAINAYRFQEGQDQFVGNSKIEVEITGTSAESFSDAQFDSYHMDQNGDGSGWQAVSSFTADDATKTNTLLGANVYQSDEWGDNQGQMYGQWGEDLVGSVQFGVSGEYDPPTEADCLEWGTPQEWVSYCAGKCYDQQGQEKSPNDNGKCEFTQQGTESFDIDNATSPPSFSIIANSASEYFDVVSAADLPEIGDIESQVEFIETWDCTAPSEFIQINAVSLGEELVSACETEREEDMWRMCEEQERAAQDQS